ncbi:conserved hypothetical protein [Delftia phage PhiW-14]|uniref:5-hmdU DNA kinase n=1 Tax=Delftia phage PhiW-14 TaxID=665032 RepID=HMUDK_BPW14|nr:terminase small subunit [Delftia phage PhiW-14]C9DG08.1 RecName: Full=5-hmdU DNA kinase; AltName: Full=5-hydroxymethyluracil DNA kinase; AltName: Full=P-loop kinase; AltName: Full=gp37 [Delftia phage PhiW-14]ACV50059.1 conserved hypothetical protein [Delftia phage PhiW-14]
MSNTLHEGFKFGDPGLINIRGTNGSGKSTIVKRYIPKGAVQKRFDDIGTTYYDCGTHFVVGRYETDCGGLDAVRGTYDPKTGQGIRPFEAGQIAIGRLAPLKTTFAEGVIYGTTFKGSKEVHDELAKTNTPYFWFSIDMPFQEVFDSVLLRRVKSGNADPLSTENIAKKFRPVLASLDKAVDAGLWTIYGHRDVIAQNVDDLVNNRPLTNADLIGRKPDLTKFNKEAQVWFDKGTVSPTQEMIDEHFPKPTTHGLGGFFKG